MNAYYSSVGCWLRHMDKTCCSYYRCQKGEIVLRPGVGAAAGRGRRAADNRAPGARQAVSAGVSGASFQAIAHLWRTGLRVRRGAPVGVDLERRRKWRPALASRYFGEREVAYVLASAQLAIKTVHGDMDPERGVCKMFGVKSGKGD